MLATVHIRRTYHELSATRARLMGLRETRTGLFIKKGHRAFSCHSVLTLLADIAAATLEEIRLMLCLDLLERDIRARLAHRRGKKAMRRVTLGSEAALEAPLPPRRRLSGTTAFFLTLLALQSLPKPRP